MISNDIAQTHRINPAKLHNCLLIALMVVGCFLILTSPVYAGNQQTTVASVLCSIIQFIYTSFARGLATAAIVMLGAGALLGKTSWAAVITVTVGITIMYGAANIAQMFTGVSACSSS